MALFNSRSGADSAESDSKRGAKSRPAVDTVEDMRRRARHRLIGACLLVLVGIVIFPILFDTQPRPLPVAAEVDIPGIDSAPPLRAPVQVAANNALGHEGLADGEEIVDTSTPATATRPADAAATMPAAPKPAAQNAAPARAAPTPAPSVAQAAANNQSSQKPTTPASKPAATAEKPAATTAAAKPASPEKPVADKPAQTATKPVADKTTTAADKPSQAQTPAKPAEKPATQVAVAPPPPILPPPAATPPARTNDAARAQALLDGRSVETVVPGRAEQGRFIVQVGAYTDDAKIREVRAQLDKLGMRSYTQVVQTANGRATRIRVGPFGSRDEADKASARIKAGSLPSVIMTL